MRKIFPLLFLLLTLAGSTRAQSTRTPSKEDISRAETLFEGLLKNEAGARLHVAFLAAYVEKSPWHFSTLVTLSQRLAVAGVPTGDVDEALLPCGDMAVALGGEDREDHFAQIVNVMFRLQQGPEDVIVCLTALEQIGVPAFNLLGESTGKTPAQVRKLALEDRLRREPAKRILLDAFRRHYFGLAEKIAKKEDSAPKN